MHDDVDHCGLLPAIAFVLGKVYWGSELVPGQLSKLWSFLQSLQLDIANTNCI